MKHWLLVALILALCLTPIGLRSSSAAALDWQLLNGPRGGSVSALAMSPNYANDRTVFAGLRGRGVYRSTDGGETWQAAGLSDQVIVDLAISPNFVADHTLFAAAGLAPGGFTIYRSTDGGTTWQSPYLTPYSYGFKPLLRLSISPDFAHDHTVYALNGAETYKSGDGGSTYFKSGGWFASHTVTHLISSPAYNVDHTLFAAVQNDQLYKSTDGGAHWNPAGPGGAVSAVAISPNYATDQTVGAVTASDGYIHLSTNGGGTWTTSDPVALNHWGGQITLLFSPTFVNDRLILAASSSDQGLYRSTDGGATWTPYGWPFGNSLGFARRGVFALMVSPNTSNDAVALAGTSTGLYRSMNRGENWYAHNNGLPHLTIRSMAIAPNDPSRLLVGTSYFDHPLAGSSVPIELDGNVQLSVDGGQTWDEVSGQIDRLRRVIFSPDFVNDQTALALTDVGGQHGAYTGGLYRSTDGGRFWSQVFMPATYDALAVSPNFAVDHTAWLYADAGPQGTGLFRSVDDGATWSLFADGFHAEAIVPSPNFALDQTLFADTPDGHVQKSTDGGATWTAVLTHTITALALSPAYGASQTIYAAAKDGSAPADLYRSTDGGATWQTLNTGIPSTVSGKALNIAVLNFAADGSVLMGITYSDTDAAAYRSVDGGATWQKVGSGLGNSLFDMASISNNSEGSQHGALAFFAGTTEGLWRIDQAQRDPTEPGVWTSTGPRGGSADVVALSPNFANDGIVLTGDVDWIRITDFGHGLFKSGDWGQTWRTVGPSLGDPPTAGGEAVHAYAFSPNFASDKTVYAATSRGLYKSTDGGDTWQWLKNAASNPVPGVTKVVLAPDYAASGHLMTSNLYGAVRLSQDFGQTWSNSLIPGSAHDLLYSPNFTSDHIIFASDFNAYRSADRGLNWTQIVTGSTRLMLSPNYVADHTVFAIGTGISKSIDSGVNWTTILSTPVKSLAISPQYSVDHTLFASGEDGSRVVYRSANGGSTWLSVTIGVSTTTIGSISLSPAFSSDHIALAFGSDGLYRSINGGDTWSLLPDFDQQAVTAVYYAPDWSTQPDVFAIAPQGLYRSDDGGATWAAIPGLAHVPIGPVVFSPGWPDQPYMLIGAAQGVYRSLDRGVTWARMPGLMTLPTSALDLSADDAAWLAGTNNGLYGTTDQGATWQPFGFPQQNIYLVAASPAYAADHTAFIEGSYGGMGASVMRTTDGGATWQRVRSVNYSGGLVLSPNYAADHTLFVLSSGVWRSTDSGDNWESVGTWLGYPSPYQQIALTPDYPADTTLFAAGPGFWRLPPGETQWQPAASGLLSTTNISAIAVAPNYTTTHTILAATYDYSNIQLTSALLRSDDGGVNWQPSGIGLPEVELNSIAFSPNYAIDHTVYLISTVQVYRSIDDGHSWTAIGAPPGWPDLKRVAVTHSGQVIVASGTGVWVYSTGFRDILIDGDAEAGNGWELIGGAAAESNVIFSGQRALRLGLDHAANAPIDSAAIQTVTIPVSATVAQLNFRAYAVSSEPSTVSSTRVTTATGDAQYATVTISDSMPISQTLLSMLSNAQYWQRYSFDLTPYAGQTVVVRVGALNDGQGGQTALYVDNASLLTLSGNGGRVYLPIVLKN
ncbi:MAG: hypothetical protein U0559_03700 [Anaerolineae bacterium]